MTSDSTSDSCAIPLKEIRDLVEGQSRQEKELRDEKERRCAGIQEACGRIGKACIGVTEDLTDLLAKTSKPDPGDGDGPSKTVLDEMNRRSEEIREQAAATLKAAAERQKDQNAALLDELRRLLDNQWDLGDLDLSS